MKITPEELQRLLSSDGITFDETGRIRLADTAEQDDYVKAIRSIMAFERDLQVLARFSIGNLVLDTPGLEDGEKKIFCIAKFGEELGRNAMNYQWTARHWRGMPQNVGWGWTWYRRLNRFPPEIKRHYIDRWKEPIKAKRIKYKQFCAELDAMSEPDSQITAVISADKADYTCIHSSLYVESRANALRFAAHECTEEDAKALLLCVQTRFHFDEEADDFADSE
jgi:hypothetical protein